MNIQWFFTIFILWLFVIFILMAHILATNTEQLQTIEGVECYVKANSSVATCITADGRTFEATIGKQFVSCNGRWGWTTPGVKDSEQP